MRRRSRSRSGHTTRLWRGAVDDISLALTLASGGDERAIGQLNTLFEEGLWH